MLGFEICLTAVCVVLFLLGLGTAGQAATVRWTNGTRQCGSCYHSHSPLCNIPLSLAYFVRAREVMQTYFRDWFKWTTIHWYSRKCLYVNVCNDGGFQSVMYKSPAKKKNGCWHAAPASDHFEYFCLSEGERLLADASGWIMLLPNKNPHHWFKWTTIHNYSMKYLSYRIQ